MALQLESHPQAFHRVNPPQGALHHPAVMPQSLLRFDAPTCDARDDVALAQAAPDIGVVVPLVAMSFGWAPPWPAARPFDGENGVEQWQGLALVVHVGRREQDRQWQSLAVYDQVVLAARLPSIRWIRARLCPPFSARTLLESNASAVFPSGVSCV